MGNKILKNSLLSFLLFVTFFISKFAYGEVMSGTTYKMDFDSINFAGSLSTTTEYILEDTLGEVATGYSSSTVYSMHAGFQQKDVSMLYLSVSEFFVTLSPSLGGVAGGISNGYVDVGVSTDSSAGYSLYIESGTAPALASVDDSFADYTPSGSDPDFNFDISSSESSFGFSVEGPDITSRFKDNGSLCGAGSLNTADKCWDGFSTVSKLISQSASRNEPNTSTTTIKFRAGIGETRFQKPGFYYATTTITAIAN